MLALKNCNVVSDCQTRHESKSLTQRPKVVITQHHFTKVQN